MQCLWQQEDRTNVKDIIFEAYLIEDDVFYLNTNIKKNKDDVSHINTNSLKISRNQFTFNNIVVTLIFHVIDKLEIMMPCSLFEEENSTNSLRTNRTSNSHIYT